jgi:hypothetical protein
LTELPSAPLSFTTVKSKKLSSLKVLPAAITSPASSNATA